MRSKLTGIVGLVSAAALAWGVAVASPSTTAATGHAHDVRIAAADTPTMGPGDDKNGA
ncbi:hypothetical protein [Streptomyces mexicanus]|jgi:hypothetical protein|uniref:hypothetical protein n=1 Tax=Streptomyces mexicanus TaxID=178566 RepID=UPI0036B7E84B